MADVPIDKPMAAVSTLMPVNPVVISAGELFRLHARFVAKFFFQLGVREQDIEDLTQEVFFIAHRRGGFLPGRATATTWLAEVAFRVASNRRRAKRHDGEELSEEVLYESARAHVGPEAATETAESLAIVQRALEALDVEKRAVMILYEIEGEDCEAIAAGLGLPVGTVYSRLHHARREFMKAHERLSKARRATK